MQNEHFDFSDTIFCDETKIQLNTYRKLSCHREGQPKKLKARFKHPVSVLAFAGISRRGRTNICIFTGLMDAKAYCEILSSAFIPSAKKLYPDGYKLHQDNDPKHASRFAKNFYEKNKIVWDKTPAESPDMNPIENLWANLKWNLARHVKPKNLQELIDGINTYWKTVTVKKCNNYINHLYKVLPRVIENNGGPTGY